VNRSAEHRVWLLVARRDLSVRLRDRGFAISTLIMLVVLTVLIVIRALGQAEAPSFTLGAVAGQPLADGVAALGETIGVEVALIEYPDVREATTAVADGSVDAALIDGALVGDEGVPGQLVQVVQAAAIADKITRTLEDYDVPPDVQASLNDTTPVEVLALTPSSPDRERNGGLAFIGVILLYGQLFGYGVWVATGVIEEKSSRVVEILLSAITARQLMAGKVIGIGALGLAQLIVIAAYGIGLAMVTGAIDVPGAAVGVALLDVGWFVLGFAFYASLFAVAGALVSRMEELQNAMTPINLVIFVSFFISVGALQSPDSLLVRIASIMPTSSALTMPVRITLGAAAPWEVVVSLVAVIGSTVVLVPLAARLYAGAVIRVGARVKIRDAWRAAA